MNKTVLSDFKAFREKWENINNIPRVRGIRTHKKKYSFFLYLIFRGETKTISLKIVLKP